MKKMVYIFVILLLGIGTNAFGDWTVVNQTGEDLSNVQLCVVGDRTQGHFCKFLSIAKGQEGIINVSDGTGRNDAPNTGTLFGVAVQNQLLNLSDLKGARSGKFSIQGSCSCPGYSFKLES